MKRNFRFISSALLTAAALSISCLPTAAVSSTLVGVTEAAEEQNAEAAGEQNAETAEGRTTEASDEKTAEASDEKDVETAEKQGSSDNESTSETELDEALSLVLTGVDECLPASNGEWSVYICDLVKDAEGTVNNHSMQAASLIKLYIMGAVYENYKEITSSYGQDMVDNDLYSMITVSDNDAANELVSFLGKGDTDAGRAVVNNFCLAHGFTASNMGRLLLESNADGDNYTSVLDCGHFLKKIYQNDKSEFPYAEEMYQLLKEQTRRNKIPAQMPDNVSIANKTGELSDVENDAGIIYDSQNDLILVFMSENLSDVGLAQNTIATLSRQIYDYYIS